MIFAVASTFIVGIVGGSVIAWFFYNLGRDNPRTPFDD